MGNIEELKKYLEKLPTSYKKNYQDIECLNFIGDSKSYLSWNKIKDLVNWKNKYVVDIGCYHGYFCFKAEQEGAKCLGLDHNAELIKTALFIKETIGSSCDFKVWTNNQPIPNSDILFCMNVFHYFDNQDMFLSKIKSKEVIFEIDKENLSLIEKYFKIMVRENSHRKSWHTNHPNRYILLAIKNG